jgi:hypothetical protein
VFISSLLSILSKYIIPLGWDRCLGACASCYHREYIIMDVLVTPKTVSGNTKGYKDLTPLHLAYLLQNKRLTKTLIAEG